MEPGCNETFVNPQDGVFKNIKYLSTYFFLLSQITRNCNCQTALCNENWKDAGGDDKIKVGRAVAGGDLD